MNHRIDDLRSVRGIGIGAVLGAALWLALIGMMLFLPSCTPGGTPSATGQQVIDVLCRGDALAQPVVVQVLVLASPASGAAAPMVGAAVATDQLLVHPAVIKACADYGSKPLGVVPAVPAGATVAAPVLIPAPVLANSPK